MARCVAKCPLSPAEMVGAKRSGEGLARAGLIPSAPPIIVPLVKNFKISG